MPSSYCTRTDLPTYGLPATILADIPTATQDAECSAASALADSYLQNHFQLPLSLWGADLTKACAVIAAFELLVTRGFNPDTEQNQVWGRRYNRAVKWLEAVGKGEIAPVVTSADPAGETNGPFVVQGSVDQNGNFTVDVPNPRGW